MFFLIIQLHLVADRYGFFVTVRTPNKLNK